MEESRREEIALFRYSLIVPLLSQDELDPGLKGEMLRRLLEKTGLGGPAWFWFQKVLLLVVLAVTFDVVRRGIPVVRMFPAFLLEACLFALILGPVVGSLVEVVGLQ